MRIWRSLATGVAGPVVAGWLLWLIVWCVKFVLDWAAPLYFFFLFGCLNVLFRDCGALCIRDCGGLRSSTCALLASRGFIRMSKLVLTTKHARMLFNNFFPQVQAPLHCLIIR